MGVEMDDGWPPSLFPNESRVELDGSLPALRPCRFCGSSDGVLEPGKGPHGKGVRCERCLRHIGWLPKADADEDALFE